MKKTRIILSISVFFLILLTSLFCFKKFLFKPKEISEIRVAIVIDDWGYNLDCIRLLRQIDLPLTISILPNLRYSSRIAEIAKGLGQEVILHLPLEPEINGRDNIGLEQHTITTAMSEAQVVDNFNLAFSSVPDINGISNHMGSQATKDKKLMAIIFRELKQRKLFFLDNLVTSESVCRQLAKKAQIKFVARDFFLDNEDNHEYIKGQFDKLIAFALANGYAVGIGHAKLNTLKVLKYEMPLVQTKGIKFVFVSDLAK